VARQIAEGHTSTAVTIGDPPFIGNLHRLRLEQQPAGAGAAGGAAEPRRQRKRLGLLHQRLRPDRAASHRAGQLGTPIIGIICGSPAASGGLTGGAVITVVNGQAVGSPSDLTGILSRFHLGQVISVTWVSPSRQRTTSSLYLTVGPPQ
jgi:S1-C subfamily serine protease